MFMELIDDSTVCIKAFVHQPCLAKCNLWGIIINVFLILIDGVSDSGGHCMVIYQNKNKTLFM